MDYSDLWSPLVCVPILLGLALAYSTRFNMRRSEDTTYAPWSAILQGLIHNHTDVFLICPQYNIYVSPLQSSTMPVTHDASFRTKADGEACGVYVDFAVLKPVVTLQSSDTSTSIVHTTIKQFLEKTSILSLPFRDIWISEETKVSILVELKPPPSRNPKNLHMFLLNLKRVLAQAEGQMQDQAHCLMCSPKFALQDSVIVIVGVGEWWTCRIVTRTFAATLGVYDELDSLGMEYRYNEGGGEDEESEDERLDTEDFFNKLVHPNQARNARESAEKCSKEHRETMKRKEVERARVTAQQNHERSLRLQNRKTKAENQDNAKAINLSACYPYSSEIINEYWKLTHGKPFMVDDTDATLDDIQALPVGESHSLPMRLGSKASAKYMELIRTQLRKMANEECKRRAG